MSQPSAEVRAACMLARAYTNRALAVRVEKVRDEPRSFDKVTKDAILSEAARRLFWDNEYERKRDGVD